MSSIEEEKKRKKREALEGKPKRGTQAFKQAAIKSVKGQFNQSAGDNFKKRLKNLRKNFGF